MRLREFAPLYLALASLALVLLFACKTIKQAATAPPLPPAPQIRALTARVRPPMPAMPPRTNMVWLWNYPDSTSNIVFNVRRAEKPWEPTGTTNWALLVTLTPALTNFWHTNLWFNTNAWAWQTNVWVESNVYTFTQANGFSTLEGRIWVTAKDTNSGLESL